MPKVFLDAGHGGNDPGAVNGNLYEKNITLSIILKVGEILKNHGVDVIYSRTTDVFIELADRAKIANKQGANVFVSIHCNSATNTSAKGVETYSYPNSTQGSKLSKDIQGSILDSNIYTVNRGTKTANFAVLRLTKMPSALVELAFISNEQDANLLVHRQEDLAIAIAKGILKNLGIKYQENTNKKDTYTIKIKVDKEEVVEVEGIVKNSTNYIPVRFLEELGFEIEWDNKEKVVLIYNLNK